MKKIHLQQNTPEWKEYRRTRIGASDCPTIMGFGYKTPQALWKEKVLAEESFVTASMQRGKDLEPLVLAMVNEGMQEKERYSPIIAESDAYPWMIASLDGWNDENGVIEIKCPNADTFAAFQNGELPPYYFWQVQHQMCVTNTQNAIIFASNGVILSCMTVGRDDAAIEQLIAKEQEFYKCMRDYVPPKGNLPEKTDEGSISLMQKISIAKENVKICKEILDLLQKEAIENGNEEEYQCAGMKVQKVVRPGAIDYKAIPILADVDLEKYRKEPVSYWTIS